MASSPEFPAVRGSLALIGGRLEDRNAAVYGELHRLSGGRVLIFPTASTEPGPVGQESLQTFRSYGLEAEIVPLLPENASVTAHDPELAARIADFGSVFFVGGDPLRIVEALSPGGDETPVLAAIRAAHVAGGLVAGSSAGAAMMSPLMLLGGTSVEAVVAGVTNQPGGPGLELGDGLGFFPFGIIDQHFLKRGRLGRLVVALARSGVRHGFGIDENTALLVEDGRARVCGEYGVLHLDMEPAEIDLRKGSFRNFRLSYLDDGDAIELPRLRLLPGAGKRRVRKREIAYRAPARSRRNVFGAYAVHDLISRLVLGEPGLFDADGAEAFDARSGATVTVEIGREDGRSRALIAASESGLRMTALDFRASVFTVLEKRGHSLPSSGSSNGEGPIVLLGAGAEAAVVDLVGVGPVGVAAPAASSPAEAAADYVKVLKQAGIEAVDLGLTSETAEGWLAPEGFGNLRGVLLAGGDRTRLVETLLPGGEPAPAFRALARAHAAGAALIAAGGAAAALSGVMIAEGSPYEALRFGVASGPGHSGLVIRDGLGLFGGGIVDQNLLGGNRLGRLIVACAEENERFGIGIFEESAVVATRGGTRLEARGSQGFALVEIDPAAGVRKDETFVVEGVHITVFGPGDTVDLARGRMSRRAPEDLEPFLDRMLGKFAHEAVQSSQSSHGGVRGLRLRIRERGAAAALLEVECPREEEA